MDIDIDFQTHFDPRTVIPQAIAASRVEKDELVKHPCGFYIQNIAIDPVTGLAAIPYKEAAHLGYFKIDFLHLSLLDAITSKQEIRQLINKEPNWNLLWDQKHSHKIFQLHNNTTLLDRVRPRSVQQLADCIAMVRPGKKQYIEQYIDDPQQVRSLLYRQVDDKKSAFRKSHAIAYALTIVVQLHLIEQGRL